MLADVWTPSPTFDVFMRESHGELHHLLTTLRVDAITYF